MTNKIKNKAVVKSKPGNSIRNLRSTAKKSTVKNISFESRDPDNSEKIAKELRQNDYIDPFNPKNSLARDDNKAFGKNKVGENNITENIKDNTPSPLITFNTP